ncbi:MAG: NAD(P)H-dependent oxidoreductase subunit E [Clostridiales bacterium]
MHMSCEKKCCSEEKQLDFSQLDKVLTQYCGTAGSLITILQNAQEIYGYLPREVIERIADKVDLKPARIYGVATFYTQFRFSPVGKYLILLCQGTACHVNGANWFFVFSIQSLRLFMKNWVFKMGKLPQTVCLR